MVPKKCCGSEMVLRYWKDFEVLGVPNLHSPPWIGNFRV